MHDGSCRRRRRRRQGQRWSIDRSQPNLSTRVMCTCLSWIVLVAVLHHRDRCQQTQASLSRGIMQTTHSDISVEESVEPGTAWQVLRKKLQLCRWNRSHDVMVPNPWLQIRLLLRRRSNRTQMSSMWEILLFELSNWISHRTNVWRVQTKSQGWCRSKERRSIRQLRLRLEFQAVSVVQVLGWEERWMQSYDMPVREGVLV